MSFGNILAQMLQDGLAGQKTTQNRLGTAAGSLAQGGGGVEQILGQIQSMLGGGTAQAGAAQGGTAQGGSPTAGFAEAARAFLGNTQAGGMTGAQLGGLGAVAGALLGGGGGAVKGAARGGAMALLGTLALQAIRSAQGGGAQAAAVPQDELDAVASPEAERLALRAMIGAAKADGRIDQDEMDKILAHLSSDEVTEDERRFVLDEVRSPLDTAALARDVRTPAQAAEVYAASLLAIDIDSDAERDYLRDLAGALRLDSGTVAYLHRSTGAPTI
jgi:uncharacterized membrane protein YebE (DUF533 family)